MDRRGLVDVLRFVMVVAAAVPAFLVVHVAISIALGWQWLPLGEAVRVSWLGTTVIFAALIWWLTRR